MDVTVGTFEKLLIKTELRALLRLGKCFTTKLQFSVLIFLSFLGDTGSTLKKRIE